jgi:hypothetical protein
MKRVNRAAMRRFTLKQADRVVKERLAKQQKIRHYERIYVDAENTG